MQEYKIQVIRSKRKSLSVEITTEGNLRIRAPYRMPDRQIQDFLVEKQDWIRKHLKKSWEQKQNAESFLKLTSEDISKLADEAMEIIPKRVAYYAKYAGVTYGRITIRNQRTRWGSCSAKGNLNFNCLLMLAPPEVLDYVVVHELCHRKEMNHSKRFWDEVEKIMPDYKEKRKWLKDNGGSIMARMINEV